MISNADKHKFQEHGYLLVENVVPAEHCRAVIKAIAAFLDIEPDNPAHWSRPGLEGHGIVPVHHAPALWRLRQQPALHQTFAALLGTQKLWVSIDRGSFKAPSGNIEVGTDPIHWDGDPRIAAQTDAAPAIQGLVYLSDTPADQGPFCCIPDIYQNLTDYLAQYPIAAETRRPVLSGRPPVVPVPGPAGSLVVWHRGMPHSSLRNNGVKPRWVQYVTMDPAGDETQRAALANLVQQRLPPKWAARQNVPGQQIPEPGVSPASVLTTLGQQLAGLAPWPGPPD